MAKAKSTTVATSPREGMPSPQLSKTEFKTRYLAQFADPEFTSVTNELHTIADIAWAAYDEGRKSPNTRKAGSAFHNPDYDLSVDWYAAHQAVTQAQKRHDDQKLKPRILLINGSSRSEHTCPGEMSKSFRLVEIAKKAMQKDYAVDVDILDLSRLASEYGRNIHPCKACFSTAAPLCHWPCSCYPNHAMGQTQDWMNEIYPLWVEAHGVMIVTPVNWYQVTSPIKLMMDRLVCADGGNPDPTLTDGKDAKLAKSLELKGWDYPRHLEGRAFAVVVHGDVEGTENVRRSLSDWMRFMKMVPGGRASEVDRYIGYWEPYATSHDALDKDNDIQEEVRNAARSLAETVVLQKKGKLVTAGEKLVDPRQK
jgi:multimeric flavodoxin WrbA